MDTQSTSGNLPGNHAAARQAVEAILAGVMDPEIPVLSVLDLGVVRDIILEPQQPGGYGVEVVITPTYSGCPAMDVIRLGIQLALREHGYAPVRVTQVLSPPWTTDWMSEEGRQKLRAFGIAPPNPRQQVCNHQLFDHEEAVQCPHCQSFHTHRISEFGSTACKALYQCDDCREPFDYFKCH
ncbi:MAG TPA: 1,2-phenylacetyl-CoA epoxidase subunit PaaD [Chitinophagaceae bacterium]|nr:1,2-phenylacetyl-CoA epoxidase subunit PaaD [Chitinophagaceae bacterium]